MFNTVQPSVLIVDDNVATVEMLTRLFIINGYRVDSALSGVEALQAVYTVQPELILLDIMMPGMNGYEVLRTLRRDPKLGEIPVIFLTAKDAPADIEQGFDLGAVDYIPKPAEPRELIARSKAKIEAHRYRKALAQKNHDLQFLLEFSHALTARLDLHDAMQLIQEAVLAVRASRQVALLYQTDREILLQISTTPPYPLQDRETAIDALTYLMAQLSVEANLYPIDGYAGYDHALAIAISRNHEVCGVLLVLAQDPIDDDEILLYQSMTQQAALALRNAALYHLQLNYAQELELTVQKRSNELVSAQKLLIQSEKLASVGRLASAIAHEINNPLTPVVLNLEMMVEDLQENRAINMSDIDILATYRSAQRIKRTLERVLQFTRNGHEDKPVLESLDIHALLGNIINLSRHYFEQNRIGLTLNSESTIPHIVGNSDQLEQVFLNIMLNARDAMETGGTLTITATHDHQQMYVRFKDTGSGIPEEMVTKMFEPFATTKGENGSGLGLFVSYEIIRNHQGAILVDSVLGQGTTFTIALPLTS